MKSPLWVMTLIDGYKTDHRPQYPLGTTRIYSNFTPRGSRVDGVESVTHFGLQYFLMRYLMEEMEEFFAAPRDEVCARYERRMLSYLGPDNNVGSEHIGALHDLGYMPLEFRAVPEGVRVPLRVPMLTVENTHDDFFWLVNYVESLMSAVLWLPCTSATTAAEMRRLLEFYANFTGSPQEFIDFQSHDFSFRGMCGPDAAALSGAAHLLYFVGTDTIPALDLVEHYYPVEEGYLVGCSVPATEHSVMCAGGEESEQETFERLLDLYPKGILSVVSDTWDLWMVLTEILPSLKDRIMARDGKLVIRPDSGDPVKIICGDPDAPEGSPAHKGVIELLWDLFGGTETQGTLPPSKRYKLLDSHIGCIYGDSINRDRAALILSGLMKKGFAPANIVFGSGSFTYQYVTRDTFSFAMKATWAKIKGVGRALFKKPVTDTGEKFSAKGRLAVHLDETIDDGDGRQLVLIDNATPEQEADSFLRPVWRDGQFLVFEGFETVRARAREWADD